MKARVTVAVIGVPILLALLWFAPEWLLAAVLAAAAALAAYEFLRGSGNIKNKTGLVCALLFAAFVQYWTIAGESTALLYAALFVFTAAVYFEAVLSYSKGNGSAVRLTATYFAAVIIPLLLSAVLRVRLLRGGVYFVILPFVAAFCSDTGAFFTGRALGKHKLIPNVSPNKTVEGAVGGLAGAVLGMVIYGLVMSFGLKFSVNFPLLLVYGLLGSAAGQLGDLSFSLMKREFGIKDYGNLLPGHGGMLDRIDSVIFTSPLIYILVLYFPAVGV